MKLQALTPPSPPLLQRRKAEHDSISSAPCGRGERNIDFFIRSIFPFLLWYVFGVAWSACSAPSDSEHLRQEAVRSEGIRDGAAREPLGETNAESTSHDADGGAKDGFVDAPKVRSDGTFWTDGQFVKDARGRTLILRGWNVADSHKVSPFLGPFTQDDYKRIRAWGFNVIRFVMTWHALEAEQGRYDEAYLKALRERLDWAKAAGLYVILDMHQDVYGVGFGANGAPRWTCPEEYYKRYSPPSVWWQGYLTAEVKACFGRLWRETALHEAFAKVWRLVASKTADHPSVIGYDLLNEPFWGDTPLERFHPDYLQPFYEKTARAIREVTHNKLLFVEPIALTILGATTPFRRFADEQMVYAPHYYHPAVHDGPGYDGDASKISEVLARLAQEAKDLKLPLWLGEYGGPHQAKNFPSYLTDLEGILESLMAGGALWTYDYGHGFAPLNKDQTERSPFLDAVRRPYPMAISGIPIHYQYERQIPRFTLRFREQRLGDIPTEIFIPKVLFGSQPTVKSSDPQSTWRFLYDTPSQTLQIWADPQQAEHTITIEHSP